MMEVTTGSMALDADIEAFIEFQGSDLRQRIEAALAENDPVKVQALLKQVEPGLFRLTSVFYDEGGFERQLLRSNEEARPLLQDVRTQIIETPLYQSSDWQAFDPVDTGVRDLTSPSLDAMAFELNWLHNGAALEPKIRVLASSSIEEGKISVDAVLTWPALVGIFNTMLSAVEDHAAKAKAFHGAGLFTLRPREHAAMLSILDEAGETLENLRVHLNELVDTPEGAD